jgi:hypothetical protein
VHGKRKLSYLRLYLWVGHSSGTLSVLGGFFWARDKRKALVVSQLLCQEWLDFHSSPCLRSAVNPWLSRIMMLSIAE